MDGDLISVLTKCKKELLMACESKDEELANDLISRLLLQEVTKV